jgi:alkylation response protein AidB-like acyl-CoA dehydrogenase
VDLTPSPTEQRFREELRAWLAEHLPPGYGTGLPPRFADLEEEVAFLRGWQRKLADARYVGVFWPVEYGGRGAGPVEHAIVQEELARARAPELVGRIGVNLVGPTLLAYGTTEQKARFLPHILPAEHLWCQLFSEPDAGSDLASLRTRAEPVPGGFRLSGRKVWTSYAQFADFGVCLARTDPDAPRHRGISFLVVDMRADGVEVRPLVQLTGDAEFNEVVLEDVFVPEDHLVGPLNGGWEVANATLAHERGTSPRQLVIHLQLLDELLALAHSRGAFDDPRLAARLAEAYVEQRLFQLHSLRTASDLEHGRPLGRQAAVYKLYWSEASQRLHRLAQDVLGPAAPLWRGAKANPGGGSWQRSFLYYQAATIFAGTSEIQRNLIAERTLGLPRG